MPDITVPPQPEDVVYLNNAPVLPTTQVEGDSLGQLYSDRKEEQEGQTNYQANIELLQSKGELGVMFSILYAEATRIEPRLSGIIVHALGSADDPVLKETGGHAMHSGKTESGQYEIIVNTDDGLEHYENLLKKRRESVKASMEKMGFDSENVDAKVLAGFIFLHELGHIVDYMNNAPDISVWEKRREAEMATLPVPKYNPVTLVIMLATPEGKLWFDRARTALENNYRVKSAEELVSLQDKRYRSLPTEDIPDQFAAKVMKRFA